MAEGEKIFYSIKEVASSLGESESTLRYWEGEFPEVISPFRNSRGVRFYKEEDIDSVRLVRHLLRERRLTIEGARIVLKNNKEDAKKRSELVHRLKCVKEGLRALEKALGDVEKSKSQKAVGAADLITNA